MKNLLLLVFLCFAFTSYGYINPELKQKIESENGGIISSRNDCQPAESQDDLDINNVRARLLVGGDLWWNKAGDGRYIVPKPAPGFDEVSALFAGGVWIGGNDQNDNLKLAAVTFATGNATDWYPGPLDEDTGTTDLETCNNWDKFFTIRGQEVREHVAYISRAEDNVNCDSIVDNVKYWPAKGNPFFSEKYGFQLPVQDLAPFYDFDVDGIYNPCAGDFPIVDIRGCEPFDENGNGDITKALKLLPDEMKYWIYNDSGNEHLSSRASKIQMEVRVQAFAYATNDEINDMTFYRYKLVNRATDPIGDCYFAMFVDPDLGCFEDDYIGCDTTKVRTIDKVTGEIKHVSRDLMYVYNQDKIDGTGSTCNCGQSVPTYCDDVPVLGVDYFRGPRRPYRFIRDEEGNVTYNENGEKIIQALKITDPDLSAGADTLVELGMTSFTYFNNSGLGDFPTGTTDPELGFEYYNYMTGRWKDGTLFTNGGSGYDPESSDTTRFALPSFPNEDGWNMCTADLPVGDRRTVQATGPLLLAPGATNELIVGVVYVPSMVYPCPEMSRLIAADEIAQNLFDACFEIIDGPNAPDLYSVELDQQLILMLGNDPDPIKNNNANEEYVGLDINAPLELPEDDKLYRFEGYKIYQLADANVSVQELDDIERARVVRQVDIKNGISEIYNWSKIPNPLPEFSGRDVWSPTRQVEGADAGIEHSFNILSDAFADGDSRLVNHKNYHYTVLAYAYNNYGTFDEDSPENTQSTPYLEGRMNVKTYTFTPRPIIYNDMNSAYGDEAIITRIQGEGTGQNFLDMEDEMYDLILSGNDNGEIVYKKGNSPINVKVTDPLRITDGEYRLEIKGDYDDDDSDPMIEEGATWILTDLSTNQVVASEKSIDALNEQLIAGKGFSVAVNQVNNPGDLSETNGYIGQALEYDNAIENNWLEFVNPSAGFTVSDGNSTTVDPSYFAYAQTSNDVDPDGAIATNADYFIPLRLATWNIRSVGGSFIQNYSPGWQEIQQAADNRGLELKNLNNVDIVMTNDKSQWSRCPVVETSNRNYNSIRGFDAIGEAGQFDLRRSPSVDKDGNPDGTGDGMGWFPGYAVDVETGERMVIFFGENSIYRDDLSSAEPNEPGIANNGDDMLFNPSSDLFPEGGGPDESNPFNFFGGGQHFIYVTRVPYTDENIVEFSEEIDRASQNKRDAISMITWTGWPILSQTADMLSYEEGYVPNDVKIKLRVTNPYNKELAPDGAVDGRDFVTVGDLPVYNIKFENSAISAPMVSKNEELLEEVGVVPNPYYAYSSYETSQYTNVVKVTNLPDRAIVTIYSLDGKFIRQFNRDESPSINGGNNPVFTSNQTSPALEWDLNNFRGIPVASGVYIFHIEAPDLNAETSLKWFGVNRKFDPSGL